MRFCFYQNGLLQSKSTRHFLPCAAESFKTNVTKNATHFYENVFYNYCFAFRHQMSPEIKHFAGNLSALF